MGGDPCGALWLVGIPRPPDDGIAGDGMGSAADRSCCAVDGCDLYDGSGVRDRKTMESIRQDDAARDARIRRDAIRLVRRRHLS